MTSEQHKKGTELLKQISDINSHILAVQDKNYGVFPYPFMDSAQKYLSQVLPKETINKFLLDYKLALETRLNELKKEFENL